MAKYKLTWRDLSWKDFKIYLFALFKAFIPKKKNTKFRRFRKLYTNEVRLGNSSNSLRIFKNKNGHEICFTL